MQCVFCHHMNPSEAKHCAVCSRILSPPPIASPITPPSPLPPAEQLLLDAPANLYRGMELIGGRLKISDHFLYFQPHALNLSAQVEVIPLSEVMEAKKVNILGIIPNGLSICNNNGKSFRFAVPKRDNVIDILRKLGRPV